MFISPAYAQAFGGNTDTLFNFFVPMLLLAAVWYFLVLRPQQQKANQQKAMLSALRRGDRVVTGGGFVGTVAKVMSDDEIMVDLAEGVRVRVIRSTISTVLTKTEPVAAKSGDDKVSDDKGDADKDKEVEVAGGDVDKRKGRDRRGAGGK